MPQISRKNRTEKFPQIHHRHCTIKKFIKNGTLFLIPEVRAAGIPNFEGWISVLQSRGLFKSMVRLLETLRVKESETEQDVGSIAM